MPVIELEGIHGREAVALAAAAIDRGAVQKESELAELVTYVSREIELRYVLEVGTLEGGTLWLWTQLALPNASLVAIDRDLSPLVLERCYSYRRAEQRMRIWHADSHDALTIAEVSAYCGRRRLDLLFIDGDHELEGVRADFNAYAPLVRPGGLVVLHDTHGRGEGHPTGPRELVAELAVAKMIGDRRLGDRVELFDRNRDDWGGFTVYTIDGDE